MNLGFFVEFPEEEIPKLSLVDFHIKVYLAANSLDEFRKLEKMAREVNPRIEAAYWPLLEKSHWVSPFSYNRELDRLHGDLSQNDQELEILIDLELPKFWLRYIILHIPRVLANALKYHLRLRRPRIRKLFRERDRYNIEITTTSYPVTSKFYLLNYLTFKLFGLLGVHFNPKSYRHNVIFMCYSSIRRDLLWKTLKNVSRKRHKEYYQLGLGLLDYGLLSRTGFIQRLQSIGILKKFSLLTPHELDRDLSLVKEYGVENVTIYGLGGLDDEFLEVLRKYASK
ncbi:hypothetical protein GF319_01060 [Candidatus Bathyarchaeota archaeon]|nr:hypothetical protein [Candidatus Bathyarchaeota archaeon]